MAFPDCRRAVFRIHKGDDPDTFGTGFVVHVERGVGGKEVAFLVTCAHVVDACEGSVAVAGQPAIQVAKGKRDGVDLAVIKADLDVPGLHPLPITRDGAPDEELIVSGFRQSEDAYRRVSLEATFGGYEDLELDSGIELRLIQFRLPQAASIEPNELETGYSGSPLLSTSGVCAVVDARRMTAGEGTYKIGSAFPLWQLAKIWEDMQDEFGERLFGVDYWPILIELNARCDAWADRDLVRVFQTLALENSPEDYSLWGCAVTIRKFENPDRPTELLRRFVVSLAESAESSDLIDVLPPLAENPELGGPDDTAEKRYRRLIIRIVERQLSPRGASQRGRRYEMQVHTATCDPQNGNCCGEGCIDCAPAAAGALHTIRARTLDEVSESGLAELLEEEISDILGLFGSDLPDLVQIVAPEQILANLIFDAKLDQILVWGG